MNTYHNIADLPTELNQILGMWDDVSETPEAKELPFVHDVCAKGTYDEICRIRERASCAHRARPSVVLELGILVLTAHEYALKGIICEAEIALARRVHARIQELRAAPKWGDREDWENWDDWAQDQAEAWRRWVL